MGRGPVRLVARSPMTSLGWLKPQELSSSLGVEGSFDHADVECWIFEDGGPVSGVASKPLYGSAFVSAQGGAFGYVARKNGLGVSHPGLLPWMRNSF